MLNEGRRFWRARLDYLFNEAGQSFSVNFVEGFSNIRLDYYHFFFSRNRVVDDSFKDVEEGNR